MKCTSMHCNFKTLFPSIFKTSPSGLDQNSSYVYSSARDFMFHKSRLNAKTFNSLGPDFVQVNPVESPALASYQELLEFY